MKRLLVIAAGELQIPVIKKAHELGYYVIAVDGNPNACGLAYADKAIVADIVAEDEMVAIAKQERIDGVIHPCSEVAMLTMGRINDELGLHGIGRDIAICATNKHKMREAFVRYGAPGPQSYCTDNVEECWTLFNKSLLGDAIIKPSRNSGSRGVAKISKGITYREFQSLFERAKEESRDHSVMIEQFIDGPEFSVEIIVWDRIPHIIAVTDKKTSDVPYFVELGHNQPSCFPSHSIEIIKDAAISGVKALQLDNCAAHAELKLQNGQAYIMEIGARLGGDFISTELTHISTGIDMVAAAINVSLGIEPILYSTEKGRGVCIRYFCPKSGILLSIDNTEILHDPHIYDYNIYRHIGDKLPEIRSSLDRSGHVIATGCSVQSAIALADRVIDTVKFEISD